MTTSALSADPPGAGPLPARRAARESWRPSVDPQSAAATDDQGGPALLRAGAPPGRDRRAAGPVAVTRVAAAQAGRDGGHRADDRRRPAGLPPGARGPAAGALR